MRKRQRSGWNKRSDGRASIALLTLGAVIIGVMAWQTIDAARSRSAAVERLAQDYSAVAAWSFHRFANASLHSVFEHLMHPVHPSADNADRPLGASALMAAHQHDHSNCIFVGNRRVEGAIHFRLRGVPSRVEVAGTLAKTDAEPLVQLLTNMARQGYQYDWMSALKIVPAGNGVQPLGYYARRVGTDTLVWAASLNVDGLRSIFENAAFGNDLLPPSLTGPMATDEFLSLGVWTSDRHQVWGSRTPPDASPMEPMFDLGPRWGGLQLAAVTLPQVAPRLAIGGPPPGRLTVTIGLLLLTLGLLTVALSNVRKAAELARLRTDFVSSVSHDLRTPLALQRVSIDTLRLGRARDAGVSALALTNIDREATRLTHLVDNLLRFSRAETANTELRLDSVNLGRIIETTVEVFGELIESVDARVVTDVDEHTEVLADVDGLGRVLLNLLENAVKYGRSGQTIRVGLTSERGQAIMTVDDEGAGVDPSERDLIWEPFSRGAEAVRGAAAGSGIGLSVVREIISAHGGSARVVDAPRGGARFEVRLPLAEQITRRRQPHPPHHAHAWDSPQHSDSHLP